MNNHGRKEKNMIEFSYENCRFIDESVDDVEVVDWSDLRHIINWSVEVYMEEEERIAACTA